MKQVLQSLHTGETFLEDIPCPVNSSGSLLIESTMSLISAGTEKMLINFGKAGLLGKIRQQPDKVKMVLDKIKTDGLKTTFEAVKSKLDNPLPLGYCNVGRVLEAGSQVAGFEKGQRVVSNGYHSEIVCVPKNLCAKIPDNVSDEQAAYTVIGAIALQGVRLSEPTLGERYVVMGQGLIGLLTTQLLLSSGCQVLAVDFDEKKLQLAASYGASTVNLSRNEDPIAHAEIFSGGKGVDAVIIAAASKSNEPLHQAASMCRKRGRIILVGVIGNEFSRADFYEKELRFQVSCSYGPGRYDPHYEEEGQDYPFAFVRWTEQRNFEAILSLMASGRLDVTALTSHRFDLKAAGDAYATLKNDARALGILIHYPPSAEDKQARAVSVVKDNTAEESTSSLRVGFIGAGNYASRILAPAFKDTKVQLACVVSQQGLSGKMLAKKNGFHAALTEAKGVYEDASICIAVIATRHNLHAEQVTAALHAGKHVFVEKPLALTLDELRQIEEAYGKTSHQLLMVGFNRRFAPQVQTIKKMLAAQACPAMFMVTVNAGYIPDDHWTQNPAIGGGRIIGEACHFIDLLRFFADSPIRSWSAESLAVQGKRKDDTASITLTFENGSCGVIHYLANGHKRFPKERVEIFSNGKILQLDNFRKLSGLGWSGFKKNTLWTQDKGQGECVRSFIEAIRSGGFSPIPFAEIMEVSRVSVEIAEYLRA